MTGLELFAVALVFIGVAIPMWLYLSCRQDRDAWHSATLIKESELKLARRQLRAYGPAGEVAKRHGCTCKEFPNEHFVVVGTKTDRQEQWAKRIISIDEADSYYALDPDCTFHLYDPAMKETGYQYLNAYTRIGKDRRDDRESR